jgi:hypothetical protein
MKACNLAQNNATHSIGQSFQENVLLKNITRFLMSLISFHLKFDISSEVKVRKNEAFQSSPPSPMSQP